jgi:hypothetical protein
LIKIDLFNTRLDDKPVQFCKQALPHLAPHTGKINL